MSLIRDAGGLGTFCVLSPSARSAGFVDAVEPNVLATRMASRVHRFPFTAVLSTAFDLPHFLTAPLIRFAVSVKTPAPAAATLLVCSPNRHCAEAHNVVLNLCQHLLPALFIAGGAAVDEVGVVILEIRHNAIIDAQTIRKIAQVGDAEVTYVTQPASRAGWDGVMEKLGDRYGRGAAIAEESTLVVQMRLPSGATLNLVDAGCSPALLGPLTLVLNSAHGVPAEKRTIAPRVGLTFAVEPLLPPAGLMHVVVLPDAKDATYSMRVLRFVSELHPTLAPISVDELAGAGRPSASSVVTRRPSDVDEDDEDDDSGDAARSAATPPTAAAALNRTPTNRGSTTSALPPRSPGGRGC